VVEEGEIPPDLGGAGVTGAGCAIHATHWIAWTNDDRPALVGQQTREFPGSVLPLEGLRVNRRSLACVESKARSDRQAVRHKNSQCTFVRVIWVSHVLLSREPAYVEATGSPPQ